MGKKAIANPKKLIRDMVSGKTLDEAITEKVEPVTLTPTQVAGVAKSSMYKDFVGEPFLVHTVTYAFCGILEAVDDDTLLLSNSTWIGDMGEIHMTFNKCNFPETEYIGKTILINSKSVIYALALPELPRAK